MLPVRLSSADCSVFGRKLPQITDATEKWLGTVYIATFLYKWITDK